MKASSFPDGIRVSRTSGINEEQHEALEARKREDGATQADMQSREDQHDSGEQGETAQSMSCAHKRKTYWSFGTKKLKSYLRLIRWLSEKEVTPHPTNHGALRPKWSVLKLRCSFFDSSRCRCSTTAHVVF
jgi:hypothetical protein